MPALLQEGFEHQATRDPAHSRCPCSILAGLVGMAAGRPLGGELFFLRVRRGQHYLDGRGIMRELTMRHAHARNDHFKFK
jgi:hypothetical protein